MATLKLLLDTRNKKAKKFPLVIKVSHKSLPKNISTGYKIGIEQWDDGQKKILRSYPNSVRANAQVAKKLGIAKTVIADIQHMVKELTVYQVVKMINDALEDDSKIEVSSGTCVIQYGQQEVKRLEEAGKYKSAKIYTTSLNSLTKFAKKEHIYFDDIDLLFLKKFEAYCLGHGSAINTVGAYLKPIRVLFNLAIKDKSTTVNNNHYPFGRNGYSIKTERTKKRAISKDWLTVIKNVELVRSSHLWHSRNYFMFMFYCRGMNFVDLCKLEYGNISDGVLEYKRSKTGAWLRMKLTDQAKEILEYYCSPDQKGSILIFPMLEGVKDKEKLFKLYQNRLLMFNRDLKKIAEKCGIDINLTGYVARHSFATLGRKSGVSKSLIGDMLGHSDYKVTETYFASLESEIMDEAADGFVNI